ncbi:hypothetical protein CGQ24_08280 [Arthrobacter sp. 7749]|nr:hypothetical protein CGQ24_08280 [Arthrobacter sp. 7749]
MSQNQALAAALFAVESIHHIHGQECLCGFKSAVSRERTKHIMEVTLAAASAPVTTVAALDINVYSETTEDYLAWKETQ